MQSARIADLLTPFLEEGTGRKPATEALLRDISMYIDLLLRWNARINLTAIRDPEEIVTRHFGESLFAARHVFPEASSGRETEKNSSALSAYSAVKAVDSVADVGSGAGFPGLPIKLWAPQVALTLVESNHKKATFLREVTRALTLTDVNIQNARAEDLPPTQRFNVVTLRAVEHFADTLPLATNLLAPSGRLALLIGTAQLDQARSILPTFQWDAPVHIPQSTSRALLIGQK